MPDTFRPPATYFPELLEVKRASTNIEDIPFSEPKSIQLPTETVIYCCSAACILYSLQVLNALSFLGVSVLVRIQIMFNFYKLRWLNSTTIVGDSSSSSRYRDAMSDTDSEKAESEVFLPGEKGPATGSPAVQRTITGVILAYAWPFSTFALLLTTIYLSLQIRKQSATSKHGSYETGFATDMHAARDAIELVQVRFTGGLLVNENGTLYRPIDPNEPQYVGEPSPEIDKNWANLLFAPEVGLYGEDAAQLVGHTYQMPESGAYRSALDVFHTLHCVNTVRQELDNWYYDISTHHEPKAIRRMHVDHCLDYLRQAVMCSADLTPATLFWSEAKHRVYNSFTNLHTCRNLKKLQDWSKAHSCGSECP